MKAIPVITVVGSISIDLIASVTRRPGLGETIKGESFQMAPGGKGANQAVAAARLGAQVNMIGRIGTDQFGIEAKENLQKENVSTSNVEPVTGSVSGIASITLAENDNSIVYVAGANDFVTPEYISEHKKIIQQSDVVLTQLEIPMDAAEEVGKICTEANVPLILNPAPAQSISELLISNAAYLTPNEVELESIQVENHETKASTWLEKIIVTKGNEGVLYHDGKDKAYIQSHEVETVDTTGAGDTFNGALAYAIATGKELKQAIIFANTAAALSVTKLGAQQGMPTLEKVEAILEKEGAEGC